MIGNSSPGLIVQDRDRQLLGELAVMRVIDREQAKCVGGFGSTTRANCRLLALTRAGLLRRFFLGTTGGGKKALYALSPSAAKLVDVPYRGPRRKRDEVLVADFFVSHQLFVNHVYCLLKCRAVTVPGTELRRWLNFYEPLEGGSSLIPDGYLELASPSKALAAFLEVDLGHEGLSVWKAKVRAYLQYAVSGKFDTQFGQPRFRVLAVANSLRRMESLRRSTVQLTDKIFWFTTFDSINREGLWSPIWLRPKDDQPQSLA